MSKFPNSPTKKFLGEDFLFAYRKRIWFLFAAVFIVIFLPGSIFIFYKGFQIQAVAVLLLLGVFALYAYSVAQSKAPRLMMAVFVGCLSIATGLSILQREAAGVFWVFPAILLINFLSFGRVARIYTALYFVFISSIILYSLPLEVSSRAITGMIVTITITNIFLSVINKLQAKLVEQSTIDPLTGALNRREMIPILSEAIERKRRTETSACVLLLDVDEFKTVNDTYGHATGDHVLTELVLLLQSRARQLDKIFRLGGEEFMIFLPDTPGSGAANVAETIRCLVAEKDFIDGRTITISIGVSELEKGETIEEWIKRGDDHLLLAKHIGRNQVVSRRNSELEACSLFENSVTSRDLSPKNTRDVAILM